MKLPNGDRAVVPIEKLRDYCLNPAHPSGKEKARVFRAALGITQANWTKLRDILLDHARTADARVSRQDGRGTRYIIDETIAAARGRLILRSVWFIASGQSDPRLATCFLLV